MRAKIVPSKREMKARGNPRIENDLCESEKKYRTLVDNSPVGVYRTTLEGDFRYVNRALARMLGFRTPKELMSHSVLSRYKNPKARAALLGLIKKRGKAEAFETELLTKTGEARNVLLNAVLEGNTLSGMVIDITEHKRAEAAAGRLLRQNGLILSSAGEGILGLDIDGNVTFVNPAAANMLGYAEKELIGKPSHRTWHHTRADGSPYPKEECPIYAAYKDGKIHCGINEVFWRKNGTCFPVEYTSTPIREGQRLAGAVVTFTDITQRKKTDDELMKFKLGLELSNDAAFITDIDGAITYANRAFEKIYGYTKEEALGKTPRIIKSGLIPKEQYRQFWDTLLAKKVISGEITNKKKDGTLVNIEGSNNPIIDESGNIVGFLAIHRDITERKKTEEDMKKLNDELKSKLAELERFSRLTVGRELKMIELKKRIREMESKRGGPVK